MMEEHSVVLRENLIHLAVVDFLASAAGPWDHDLMAPSDLPGLRCLARSRASLAAENAFKRQNAMLAVSPWRTCSPWYNPTMGLLLGERS